MAGITVVGTPTSANATTVSVPAHAIGDYIIIVALRSTTTAPSLPAGYTNIVNGSGNSNSYRVGFKVATATNDASGTWTNATILLCCVYRGVGGIGASSAATKAASTTANIPTITLLNQNSNSWVLAFAGHAATSTQGTPGAGATTVRATQTGGTYNGGLFDTNAGVNTFGATTSSNTTSVVSCGGSIELISADSISTLFDKFSDTSLNTNKWNQFTNGSATFTYDQTGAQVNFPASSTNATDGDITSNLYYDLTGVVASLGVPVVASAATFADCVLQLKTDANNFLRWVYEGGTLYAQYMLAGAQTTVTSFAYNAATHAWWRIRESGGTTFWDTSPDRVNWTNQGSVANSTHGVRITAILVNIAGVCFENETNPGAFKWNNFNTVPSLPFPNRLQRNTLIRT